jgi:hypothetical protein
MNPTFLFLIFAIIAIIALSFSVISDFWMPMLICAALVAVLVRIALPNR